MTVDVINTKQWHDKMLERATKDFENHVMTVVGPGHWRIYQPGNSVYWAEIVVMSNRAISVWGDIDACVFAYCSGAENPEAVIKWMANADPIYYGRQKANIGMGNIGVDDYDEGVFRHDILCRLKDAEEEFGEDWNCKDDYCGTTLIPNQVFTEAADMALDSIRSGDHDIREIQHNLLDALQEVDQEAREWIYDLGRVTSLRVIYALAAIRRLWTLLQREEKREAENPKEA